MLVEAILGSVLVGVIAGWVALERRRRRRLNGSLHEIRRPAQVLALLAGRGRLDASAVGGCLDQLALGIDDLDRQLNGGPPRPVAEMSARELADEAERRWGWSGRVRVVVGEDAAACGSPATIAAAIDNLVANSLEHGSGPVTVETGRSGNQLALSVVDSGPGGWARSAPRRPNPRRGHGLELVAAVAADHGGEVERSDAGHIESLRLPLSDAA